MPPRVEWLQFVIIFYYVILVIYNVYCSSSSMNE